MQSPAIGDLTYDPSVAAWIGAVTLSALTSCRIRWETDGRTLHFVEKAVSAASPKGGVPVHIASGTREPPTAEQEAALINLIQHAEAVIDACLKFAMKECKRSHYEALPALQDLPEKLQSARRRLNTLKGFCELIEPLGIDVLSQSKDGMSYIAFDFNTSLDEEHGLSVLMHDRLALGMAGAAEQGGGPPPDEGPLMEWLNLEARLLELLNAVADVPSVKAHAAEIGSLNRRCLELNPQLGGLLGLRRQLEERLTFLWIAQLKECQRIWKTCPDAGWALEPALGANPYYIRSRPPGGVRQQASE